jgi:hypothetical protein
MNGGCAPCALGVNLGAMFGQFGQSAFVTCLRDLKAKLAAAGFTVGAGDTVDLATWQAVAVLAGSLNADRLAGKDVTPEVQAATCPALAATLAKQTPEALNAFVFEQRKRLQGVPGPAPGVVVSPLPRGVVVALAFGAAMTAIGAAIVFWPAPRLRWA